MGCGFVHGQRLAPSGSRWLSSRWFYARPGGGRLAASNPLIERQSIVVEQWGAGGGGRTRLRVALRYGWAELLKAI